MIFRSRRQFVCKVKNDCTQQSAYSISQFYNYCKERDVLHFYFFCLILSLSFLSFCKSRTNQRLRHSACSTTIPNSKYHQQNPRHDHCQMCKIFQCGMFSGGHWALRWSPDCRLYSLRTET